jgi:hypothetical protein
MARVFYFGEAVKNCKLPTYASQHFEKIRWSTHVHLKGKSAVIENPGNPPFFSS